MPSKTETITAAEYQEMLAKKAKVGKHKNIKVTVDDIKFDSGIEGKRYGLLKLRLKLGEITELELQPEFEFVVNGKLICKYRGDFQYRENGVIVVEDTKSAHTRKLPVYRIKKKLMAACFNIEIKEVIL